MGMTRKYRQSIVKRVGREKAEGKLKRRSLTSVFLPDMLSQVKQVAWLGLTDDEIAKQYGIDPDVFAGWKAHYPEFRATLEAARGVADSKVIQSLYKECIGYHFKEEVVAGRTGAVKEVKRFARPNGELIKFYLKNRQKERWAERHSIDGGSKADGSPIPLGGEKKETNAELIASIVKLVAPKPDNPK
jgi:hypothetical protein